MFFLSFQRAQFRQTSAQTCEPMEVDEGIYVSEKTSDGNFYKCSFLLSSFLLVRDLFDRLVKLRVRSGLSKSELWQKSEIRTFKASGNIHAFSVTALRWDI